MEKPNCLGKVVRPISVRLCVPVALGENSTLADFLPNDITKRKTAPSLDRETPTKHPASALKIIQVIKTGKRETVTERSPGRQECGDEPRTLEQDVVGMMDQYWFVHCN